MAIAQSARRGHARSLLAQAAFRRAWFAGAVASIARWLDMLVAGVVVFDLSGSALQVAIVVMLRMLPLALFGALAGALVERVDRRTALVAAALAMMGLTSALAAYVVVHGAAVWQFQLLAFVTGVFWVLDFSARRTLLADVAEPDQVGTAMSLESVVNNGTRLLGPLTGGLLLERAGPAGAMAFLALLYLVNAALLRGLPAAPAPSTLDASGALGFLRSVREGFAELATRRDLVAVLLVTVVFNLFAFPGMSMVPVIAKEALSLGAFGVGLLTSAEGVGALTGALVIVAASAAAATRAAFRRIYVSGVATFLVAMVAFSLAGLAPLAGAALMLAGLGSAAFASMQSTLVLLNSAPALRGRMMGVLSMCIGTAPLGFAHVGLLAEWLGAPLALRVIAAEGAVALALICWWEPRILARQPRSAA